MRQLRPAAQSADETEGGGLTDAILGQADPAPEPMVQADPTILWPTAVGVIAIFFLVMFLLMRLRVRQSERARKRAPVGEFFQPAGEDAEITFDDGSVAGAARPRRGAHQGDLAPVVEVDAPDEDEIGAAEIAPDPDEPLLAEIETAPARKEGPFARLFARKKKPETGDAAHAEPPLEEAADGDEASDAADEFAEVVIDRTPARFAGAVEMRDEEAEEAARRAATEAERERRREEEEAARARAEERERLESERRERAYREREAEFERRKRDAAADSEAREAALRRRADDAERAVEQLRYDLAHELDNRFTEFGRRLDSAVTAAERAAPANDEDFRKSAFGLLDELDQRIARLGAENANVIPLAAASAIDSDAIDRLAADMRRSNEDLRRSIADITERIDAREVGDFEALRQEIASLRDTVSTGRHASPSAPSVQLADIVRNALPPDAYEMRAALSNHRTADCLVRLPHPPGPVAIDARFPVEAFHRLAAGASISAENEFRRAALKHVADVAERLIIPGETAQSAMIFLPSESMYTELHARFADVVQDSYRARTWFVSPTTLMAALHTIRGVLADLQRTGPGLDSRLAMAEIDALRRRVAALEASSAQGDDYLYEQRETAAATAAEWPDEYAESYREEDLAPEKDEAAAPQIGDLASREPEEGVGDSDESDAPVERRAPFPLR